MLKMNIPIDKRTATTVANRSLLTVILDNRIDSSFLLFWLIAVSLGPLKLKPKLTKIFEITIIDKDKLTKPNWSTPIEVIKIGIETKLIKILETWIELRNIKFWNDLFFKEFNRDKRKIFWSIFQIKQFILTVICHMIFGNKESQDKV